jgi:hypothetical protein
MGMGNLHNYVTSVLKRSQGGQMKKSIAALALAGTIALTGTAPAMAANYPAPPANSQLSQTALLVPAKPLLSLPGASSLASRSSSG